MMNRERFYSSSSRDSGRHKSILERIAKDLGFELGDMSDDLMKFTGLN